jgi:hypothetical protein
MVLNAQERSVRARFAAYAQHAADDPHVTTAAARAGFVARFEKQVDPDGTLPPEERARRTQAAIKSHMVKLAFYSARVRRQRREAKAGAK